MKQFIYFEDQDGGMGVFAVNEADDFRRLYGWMRDDCRAEDLGLLSWMVSAEVGEMHEHRLGCLVRLKDWYRSSAFDNAGLHISTGENDE